MNVISALDNALVKITKNLSNVSLRDRFLKVLQYSSRFILSYYQKHPDKDFVQKLEDAFFMISNSRKFFRLFNSIGSIKQVNDIFRHNSFTLDPIGTGLQVMTQVFWGSFFLFDNIILFKRMFPRPNRNIAIERAFYSSWLGAELCRLTHILRTLGKTISRRNQVLSYIQRDGGTQVDAARAAATQDPMSRLSQLDARVRELKYNLGKSIANVFVATNIHPDTRGIYNRLLPEKSLVVKDFLVMLSAVTTSILDIYENVS